MRNFITGVCLFLLFIILPVIFIQAGAVTNSYGEIGSYHFWKCDWVGGTNQYYLAATSKWLTAELRMAILKNCNSTGPTITATLKTADGVDILLGRGESFASNPAITTVVYPYQSITNPPSYVFNSELTLMVTNCFKTNINQNGTIILYYAP